LSPKRILEALLFASGKPLTIPEIKKLAQGVTPKEIEKLIGELREEYNREARSFELIDIAGGFQIVTRKEYAAWLARLEQQKKAKQASHSALETLAIMAYKQPVTRAEIEELRGVDISGVLLTLLERGFIKIVGKKEVPGRPFLYGTTEKFLEHFGLKSLSDMPQIAEIKTLVEKAVKREGMEGERRGEVPSPAAISDTLTEGGATPPLQSESGQ
jgi:segregation and condensation protein B